MENNVEIPKFYKEKHKEYEKQIRLYNAGWCVYYNHYGSDVTPLVSARMSTGRPSGEDANKDAGSRNFLWRHGHVSPFEQAGLSVIFQVPIPIARQIMRHKSLHVNEHSQRYSEPLFEYYIPDEDDVCYDNEFNKQMSGAQVPAELAGEYIKAVKEEVEKSKEFYKHWRALGLAKERIRDSQPVSNYTRVMATANIRDWLFFLSKRLKNDAQKEIREFAEAVYSMLQDLFPLCCEVFEEYTLNAESISRTEKIVIEEYIKAMITGELTTPIESEFDDICARNNLNKSRTRELKAKMNFGF
jgi:thymidylate synthase (FAD)